MVLWVLCIVTFSWLQCKRCAAQHVNHVYCRDVYQCANMTLVASTNEFYGCEGEHSCVNSVFINVSIDCAGAHSCENTSITLLSQESIMTATGSFALKNAIIAFAPYKNTHSIELNGYYTALNTTIYCMNGIGNTNCGSIEINCNGYGCYGNSTNDEDSVNNATLSHNPVNKNIADCISIGNNSDSLNDSCIVYHGNPLSIEALYNGEPAYYHNKLMASHLNSIDINNTLMCLTDKETTCLSDDIVVSGDTYDTLLCGRGYICQSKRIAIKSSTSSNKNKVTIVCSGESSCLSAVIYTSKTNYNYNSNYSSVICSGGASCDDTVFFRINNIYYVGSHIYSSRGTIYSGGRDIGGIFNVYVAAGREYPNWIDMLNIYCIENDECNLFCDHYHGCSNVILHCFVNASCNVQCPEGVYGIDKNQSGDCATIVNYNQTSPDHVPNIVETDTVTQNTITTSTRTAVTSTEVTSTSGTSTAGDVFTSGETTHTTNTTKITRSSGTISTRAYYESGESAPDSQLGETNATIKNTLHVLVLYAMIGISVIGIGFTLFVWIYHKFIHYQKGCDVPKYKSILSVMRNIGDLYSDAIFCLYLGLVRNEFLLFLFATSITLISHFVSNLIGFQMIKKLESMTNRNFNCAYKYVAKYDLFLLIMSMFAGFYATVELASSQLLYLDIFHLRLGKKNISKVRKYYFYNIVLFENGTQIIIQLIYILKHNGVFDIFVFFTMFFSVASLLIGIFTYWSHVNKKDSALAIKFAYRKKKTYLMHIISKSVTKDGNDKYNLGNRYYCHTYYLFESKLSLALNVDLFNVVINLIETNKNKNGILVYFEVNNVDLKHQTFDEICQNVKCLSDVTSIGRQFESDIHEGLGFGEKSQLKIESVKLINDLNTSYRQIDLVGIIGKKQPGAFENDEGRKKSLQVEGH